MHGTFRNVECSQGVFDGHLVMCIVKIRKDLSNNRTGFLHAYHSAMPPGHSRMGVTVKDEDAAEQALGWLDQGVIRTSQQSPGGCWTESMKL